MFVIVVYSWHQPLLKLDVSRDRFSYFLSGGGGVDKYLGVLLLALAGTWWQRPERSRKKFQIFFQVCMARSETIILVILQI